MDDCQFSHHPEILMLVLRCCNLNLFGGVLSLCFFGNLHGANPNPYPHFQVDDIPFPKVGYLRGVFQNGNIDHTSITPWLPSNLFIKNNKDAMFVVTFGEQCSQTSQFSGMPSPETNSKQPSKLVLQFSDPFLFGAFRQIFRDIQLGQFEGG